MSYCILKFGSSVLSEADKFPQAVHEIYRQLRLGHKVVAVVSAVGDTTDQLLKTAQQLQSSPQPRALAQFLATGEAESVSLLTLALERAGIQALGLRVDEIELKATGSYLDGSPQSVHVGKIQQAFDDHSVLVVPGFVGENTLGHTVLFGRGGSDLSALFLADALGGSCRLIKDVDGLYEWDPSADGPRPRRFSKISFDDALNLDGDIVQHKAVAWAQQRKLSFSVGSCNGCKSTQVGPQTSVFESKQAPVPPLKIALLGLGTVGSGVLQHINKFPQRFTVVKVVVRDSAKHSHKGVAPQLFSTNPWDVLDCDADVVVELLGGTDPAAELIAKALTLGKHVVSANKEVVADQSTYLQKLAADSQVNFLHSASVGGAVTALEGVALISQSEGIDSIEAVLNGTTSFIFDRVAAGDSFDEALATAQDLGFAEQDPSKDLSGFDVASKIAILAKVGFQKHLIPKKLISPAVEGFRGSQQTRYRLVARCRQNHAGEVSAEVVPEAVGKGHVFHDLVGEDNCVVVRSRLGNVHRFAGKGAGCWPTAESVFADLFDLSTAY